MPMWKYFLAWFPMVLIAIVNGTLREAWYGKHPSELRAHQVSTASGVLLFGLYIWMLLRIWKPVSLSQALTRLPVAMRLRLARDDVAIGKAGFWSSVKTRA